MAVDENMNPNAKLPPTIRRGDELLGAFLAEADVPCPGCGYNLRGLKTGACPECNQALTLQVVMSEPWRGRLVVTLIGLAFGVGAGAIFAMFFALHSVDAEVVEPGVVVSAAAVFVEGAALFLLAGTGGRAWFRLLNSRRATALLSLAWLMAVAWPFVMLMLLLT